MLTAIMLLQATTVPLSDRQAAYRAWFSCVSEAAETFAAQRIERADDIVTGAFGICSAKMTTFSLAARAAGETEEDELTFAARWERVMRPGMIGVVLAYRVK